MKKKMRFMLGGKLVAMILAISIVLCATALFVSYLTYEKRTNAFYAQMGSNVVRTLASQLDPQELSRYYETGEMDEQYYATQNFIHDLVENNNVTYLYVVRPHGVGVTFLFDSDMETGEKGEYYAGGYCALGTYVDLEGEFAKNLDKLLSGKDVAPIIQRDPSYGWLMTSMTPVFGDDGAMVGYVMADISMNDVVREQRQFLLYTGVLLAALTAIFVAVYLLMIRKSILRPVQQLTQAAQDYEGGENKAAFSKVNISSKDELQTLADAFRMMLEEIDRNNAEQKELAVREQRLNSELLLANELNSSMLPKELPPREGGYAYGVRGMSHRGQELGCDFYDYFLLKGDRLCVMVGKVPGSGIPQTLFTVMAQTAIKSQLRSELSLAEAMTAANRQLYEMGGGLYLNVLVGILDGATGQFTCVNAGEKPPLMLESQDRYEWLDMPAFAPLGQNENVVYQVRELEMHQGDRIFLHTEGLDQTPDKEGVPFGKTQLRLTLNSSCSRQPALGELLEAVGSAAGAYAAQLESLEGYAVLAVEYSRKDKAQAHCLVTADAEGSDRLSEFLREQLRANGATGAQTAELIVLADELFALCCRRSAPDGRFMAECAVPEEHLFVLRLKGSMEGGNPLYTPQGETARCAAQFIEKNADRVLFEHGRTMDTVTVIKRFQPKHMGEKDIKS